MQQFITKAGDEADPFLELLHRVDQAGRTVALLDVHEEDNVIEVSAELPGVRKEDIDVQLQGDVLTISAEKRGPSEAKRVHFSERSYGRFQRSIQLPFVPNADGITAEAQDGVLMIRLPRIETQGAQRIEVRSGDKKDESSAIGSNWKKASPPGDTPSAELRLTEVVQPTTPDSA